MNSDSTTPNEEVDQESSRLPEAHSVLSGNAAVDGISYRGWFIGRFLAHTCGLRATPTVEVKWGMYCAGEERSTWGTSEQATTLCILCKGRVQISFPQEVHLLVDEGDYMLWSAGVPHHWQVLEESCVLTVRWPSIPEAYTEHRIMPCDTMGEES